MKTIKVSEATNTQLDWLVGKCEHGDKVFIHFREPLRIIHKNGLPVPAINDPDGDQFAVYLEYTSNPDQMHPIIEREKISTLACDRDWGAQSRTMPLVAVEGPTALIAAARCYVVSEMGETVEVPDEL